MGSAYSQSPCSVPGCHEIIPQWRTMCERHWGMVPARIQARVKDIGKCLKLEKPCPTAFTRDEYDQACVDALRYVSALVTPPAGAKR